MLKYGTSAIPILVAKSAGHVIYPRSAKEAMTPPLQLIEGHSYLACVRDMINSSHPNLAADYKL